MSIQSVGADNILLEANGIRFRYEATSPIVLDIPALRLRRGVAYSLYGRNMSGKTTLIKLLSGVIDHPAATIKVRFDGHEYVLPNQRTTLQAAGLRACHQNDPMFPELSIWDNIWIGAPRTRASRLDIKRGQDCITAALRTLSSGDNSLGPRDLLGRLSGGGRAVVRVLRSVVWQHKLLLLDEPLANVDSSNRELLFDVLKRHTSPQTAVLLISHDDKDHEVFRESLSGLTHERLLLDEGRVRPLEAR